MIYKIIAIYFKILILLKFIKQLKMADLGIHLKLLKLLTKLIKISFLIFGILLIVSATW